MPSKRLIIFEGPDGGGKSSAIQQLVDYSTQELHVVHHGPYPNVTKTLSRLYLESMLPAVLGHRTTVLDRSWLSEPIYGKAFRGGCDRIGVNRRHLERLALRCDPLVVLCLPPWKEVLKTFRSRKGVEMLDREDQLRHVYNLYEDLPRQTDLPVVRFNYLKDDVLTTTSHHGAGCMSTAHHGAGPVNGRVLLVGDEFGERKNDDPLMQWPFASFSGNGCSQWLTWKLWQTGISERDLTWVNSDEIGTFMQDVNIFRFKQIIALGQRAHERLSVLNIPHLQVAHPQHAKRFHFAETYELISLIKKLI